MRNLLEGYLPPVTATRHNPFREWIGARLRVDVYGWCAQGDPARAARMAYEDARLSHTANGVYAAMWMAAAHAASLWADDAGECADVGARRRPAAEQARRGAALCEGARRCVGGSRRRDLRALRPATTGCMRSTTPRSSRRRSTPSTTSRRRSAASSQGGLDTDTNGAAVGSIFGALGADRAALVGAAARPLLELAAGLRRRSRSTSSPRVRSRSHDASTRSSRGRSTGRRRSSGELDNAKIIAAPDDPADWPAWRDALARWRDEARARLRRQRLRAARVDAELLLRRARLALGRAALRPRGAAVHTRASARRGRGGVRRLRRRRALARVSRDRHRRAQPVRLVPRRARDPRARRRRSSSGTCASSSTTTRGTSARGVSRSATRRRSRSSCASSAPTVSSSTR